MRKRLAEEGIEELPQSQTKGKSRVAVTASSPYRHPMGARDRGNEVYLCGFGEQYDILPTPLLPKMMDEPPLQKNLLDHGPKVRSKTASRSQGTTVRRGKLKQIPEEDVVVDRPMTKQEAQAVVTQKKGSVDT